MKDNEGKKPFGIPRDVVAPLTELPCAELPNSQPRLLKSFTVAEWRICAPKSVYSYIRAEALNYPCSSRRRKFQNPIRQNSPDTSF